MKKGQPSRFCLNLFLFVAVCALFNVDAVRLVDQVDELQSVLNLMSDHQVATQNKDEAEGILPGLKLTVTQTAFDYIEQKITPELINSLLASFTVPTINTTKDGVNVVISNVKAGNISFSSVDLAFAAGGISFQISGATGGVTLDWQYIVEYVDLGDSGTGRVIVGDINFDLLVLISAANGRPTVKVGSLSFTLGNLVIKLSGGASWFYDFFESLFNSLIVSEIQSAATSAITEAINVKAESLLESLPTVIKLPPNNVTQIDISLTSAPAFVPGQSVTLGSRGMITPAGNSQQPPYTPAAMPDSLNNQMIQILVGQYVLDTAAWAYFRSGVLSYVVTPNMIPAWFPVTLNTTSWEFIIPALYKEFPNCAMNLHFFVSQVPTIKFNAGQKYKGVAVNVIADFDVNVITKNNKVVTVFDLEVDLDLDFVVGFNGSVVHGQFYFVDFNVTIKNSTIGTFDVSIVQFLLNFVVNTLILQPLNAFLISEGIQIPTFNGVTLATPSITYNNGYIGFTTDLKLVTPAIKMRS